MTRSAHPHLLQLHLALGCSPQSGWCLSGHPSATLSASRAARAVPPAPPGEWSPPAPAWSSHSHVAGMASKPSPPTRTGLPPAKLACRFRIWAPGTRLAGFPVLVPAVSAAVSGACFVALHHVPLTSAPSPSPARLPEPPLRHLGLRFAHQPACRVSVPKSKPDRFTPKLNCSEARSVPAPWICECMMQC